MQSTEHLKRRGRMWSARVKIPTHLRPALEDRHEFVQALGTHDLRLANRLKAPLVADWLRQIDLAERGQTDPVAKLRALGAQYNAELERAYASGEVVEGQDQTHVEEVKDKIKLVGSQMADDGVPPDHVDVFLRVAEATATFLMDWVDPWRDELVGEIKEQTRGQHRAAVKALNEWAGGAATVEEFKDRSRAGEYVSHLLASGISRSTVKRHLSSLSQFWKWLRARGKGAGAAEVNPWLGQELGKKKRSGTSRKGLEDAQLVALLSAAPKPYGEAKYTTVIPDLIRLTLLSGARLDEWCALEKAIVVERTDGLWATVSDGKTDAAIRDIPIHKLAAPIIKRRLALPGRYLFEGLEPGGPDKKRSWYVSKAYGRFRRKVGLKDRWQDFHALRHTFTGMMEGQEVPESTVKLLIGHARSSMTYGLYSKGQRVDLRKAIDKIHYNPEVMRLIGETPCSLI